MQCPRCDKQVLEDGAGALGDAVCSSCHGRLVASPSSDELIEREAGLDTSQVRELAQQFSGPQLGCPRCRHKMSPVTLKGSPVDLCTGCGALWFDAGELEKLTAGRIAEPKVAPVPPPKPAGPPRPADVRRRSQETPLPRLERIDLGEFAALGCLGGFMMVVATIVLIGGVWGVQTRGSGIRAHEGGEVRLMGALLLLGGLAVWGWLAKKWIDAGRR
jgi:Zn-finger nucleic acid-binding protein